MCYSLSHPLLPAKAVCYINIFSLNQVLNTLTTKEIEVSSPNYSREKYPVFKMSLFKRSCFTSLFLTHGEPQNIELALARKECPEAKGNGCDSKFSVAICPPQFIQLYPACMQMSVQV